MDLSMDNQYIVTLGADDPQTISIWDWTNEKEDGPIVSLQFSYNEIFQNQFWVKFNPDNHFELASNGKERVLFLNWEPGMSKLQYYSPRVETKDYSSPERASKDMTKTVFIPTTLMAVTGTECGDILVWDRSLIIEGIGEQNEKRLIKIVTLNQNIDVSLNILLTVDNEYLVCGFSDGTIRFYDFQFKVKAWFEDLKLSTIKSISFSKKKPIKSVEGIDPSLLEQEQEILKKEDSKENKILQSVFECSDFIVTDSSAMVVQLQSTIYEAIDSSKKKGVTLMHGIKSSISAIAVHPKRSIIAAAGSEGFIIMWDYLKRGEVIAQQFEEYKSKDTGRDDKGVNDKKTDKDGKEKKDKGPIYTCLEFTPDGTELLVGHYKGYIHIVDPQTGQFKEQTQELVTSETEGRKLKKIIVNSDGRYFATCDTRNCVCLFKKEKVEKSQEEEWQFSGKMMSH